MRETITSIARGKGAVDPEQKLSNSRMQVLRAPRGRSIGGIMDANRGIGAGFDALRLILSAAVLCWHSLPLDYGYPVEQVVWMSLPGRPIVAIMPVFFGLSGFLVMGSAIRMASLRSFLGSRILRIFPALITEITLSAIVIGGLFTSFPLENYYTDKGLIEYFGSLLGRVVFQLPGVSFPGNPYDVQINNNLWTIPPELLSYVFMSTVIVMGLFRSRTALTLAMLLLVVLNLAADYGQGGWVPIDTRWPARYLLLSFALGNTFFMWRHSLPYRWWMFGLGLVTGLAGLRTPGLFYVSLAALMYCMAFLGVTRMPRLGFLGRGDYSYGIYLFGFPIQQLVVYYSPLPREWYWNIALALPLTTIVAMISWHFIEKPSLQLRKRLPQGIDGKDSANFWKTFIILMILFSYAAFLLRFSGVAFLEQTTLAYLFKVMLGLALAALTCTLLKVFLLQLQFRKSDGAMSR